MNETKVASETAEAEFWNEHEPGIYGQMSADEVDSVHLGMSRDSLEVVPIIWDNRRSLSTHCVGALKM